MGILIRAIIPFLVLLILALARRYMPAASVKTVGHKYSREELDVRFSSTQWIVGFTMAVVGLVFAYTTHASLVGLNRYLATRDGTAQFVLWPQSAVWWFFPGFGAVGQPWGITLQLWALFGHREDADSYEYWSSLQEGFNAPKLLRWMAILVVLPVGILTILALPVRTAFRQNDIQDCGYAFAPCKIYRYADARRLTIIDGFRTRDGKLTIRAGIVIDFADGRRWSSADIGDFKPRLDPALEEFLKNKTKLPYDYAQTEADIPPLVAAPGRSSH
jgi:hypothetical protein